MYIASQLLFVALYYKSYFIKLLKFQYTYFLMSSHSKIVRILHVYFKHGTRYTSGMYLEIAFVLEISMCVRPLRLYVVLICITSWTKFVMFRNVTKQFYVCMGVPAVTKHVITKTNLIKLYQHHKSRQLHREGSFNGCTEVTRWRAQVMKVDVAYAYRGN